MIYTGYADFWFRDVPLPERVAKFAALGIHHIDAWAWRSKGASLMDEIAAACRQNGSVINSTFDDKSGSLTDANDLPLCLDAWAESLDHARRWGVQHLFMFSEQIDPLPTPPSFRGRECTSRVAAICDSSTPQGEVKESGNPACVGPVRPRNVGAK